jgi:AcrR family transcriptional regulator
MAQIAKVCGLSSATLYRYFPTKSDLFWYGMAQNEARFREALNTAEPAKVSEVLSALTDAYLAMLTSSAQVQTVKVRMALSATDRNAAQATEPTYDRWRSLAIDFVTRSLADAGGRLRGRVIGAAWWAAVWASMTAWALSAEDDPEPIVRGGVAELAALGASLREEASTA